MKKLTLIIFLLSTLNFYGQSLSIGPQVGFIKTSDADNSKLMPSVAARLNLLNLTFEGSVGYKTDEFENGSIKTTSYPILLTAMLGVLPLIHVEAGMGWYKTKLEFSNLFSNTPSETQSKTGYHVGAGAEIPLGNLVLTGDVRYVFLDLDFNNISSIAKLKSDYYVLLVGLIFKL